ncbi:MAG: hypothetical protein AAF211_25215 [Myxococcota bacterium]
MKAVLPSLAGALVVLAAAQNPPVPPAVESTPPCVCAAPPPETRCGGWPDLPPQALDAAIEAELLRLTATR